MKWKSPRCSVACWDEIKKHDATLSKALSALVDMRRDRDEWKAQHENLLAMYRAALAATPTSAMREALEEIERTCSTRAASIARAALAAPQAQEGDGKRPSLVNARPISDFATKDAPDSRPDRAQEK